MRTAYPSFAAFCHEVRGYCVAPDITYARLFDGGRRMGPERECIVEAMLDSDDVDTRRINMRMIREIKGVRIYRGFRTRDVVLLDDALREVARELWRQNDG